MLKNYLIVAWRNLLRNKLYSLINISGLALGMACCVLIMVFIRNELSFEQFHQHVDRIYLVSEARKTQERVYQSSTSSISLAQSLKDQIPEVVQATVFSFIGHQYLVGHGERSFREENSMLVADPHLFEVLSFSFVQGDPATALRDPFSVVISLSMAEKLFGDGDPLNEVLSVDGDNFAADFVVTGVIEDLPHNSQIRPDLLLSFEFFKDDPLFSQGQTLVLLDEDIIPEALEDRFTEVARTLPAVQLWQEKLGHTLNRIYLKPLKEIHLSASPFVVYGIYIFSGLALVILLLACINYINLAIAQLNGRTREIGVRKVMGALRRQLLMQFLSESLFMACIALVLAIALVESFLPALNHFLTSLPIPRGFISTQLDTNWQNDIWFWLGSLGIALFVGLLTGSYPALILSHFRPVQILKGRLRLGGKGSYLRQGLVIFQFAISSFLILVVITMDRQIHFAQSEGVGFDEDQVIVLPLLGVTSNRPGHDSIVNGVRRKKYERDFFASGISLQTAKDALLQDARIAAIAVVNALPGTGVGTNRMGFIEYYGEGDRLVRLLNMEVDPDLIDVLRIPLVAGRNMVNTERRQQRVGPGEPWLGPSDGILVNKAAVRALGWENPVGRQLWEKPYPVRDPKTDKIADQKATLGPEIVGVVSDFHLHTFRSAIEPLMICPMDRSSGTMKSMVKYYFLIRTAPGDIKDALSFLEKQWRELAPEQPFEFSFLDEEIDRQYWIEIRMLQMFSAFSLLAIAIACLGLFGLISFMSERRIKEIGIRKILGASLVNIVSLLSKDFVKLVIIANLIAGPVAYLALEAWLQNYAYRIELGSWIFILCGALTLTIALVTVGSKAIKTALANPVEALRYE